MAKRFTYPDLIKTLADTATGKRQLWVYMKTFLSLGVRDGCNSEYLSDLDRATQLLEKSEDLDAYRKELGKLIDLENRV